MVQCIYDGSFAGFLTAVFEVYEKKLSQVSIVKEKKLESLVFSGNAEIITDEQKAERVWRGLQKKVSAEALQNIYWCFLSEIKGMEDTLLEWMRYAFSSPENIEGNFGDPHVLAVSQMVKKVGREKHRFEAFVRFELVSPDLYYAPIDPDFNILPLIVPHFRRRYPAMNWIIYDTTRKYGMHYNKESEQVSEIVIDFKEDASIGSGETVFDPEEQKYQALWKNYFKSVNIPARKNTKLHLRHVPKRYWKYLVEKR